MMRGSFMNGYCLNRLLKKGYSYSDFVECYVDSTDRIYIFPIGSTSIVSCGDTASMMFLGYSRYDMI